MSYLTSSTLQQPQVPNLPDKPLRLPPDLEQTERSFISSAAAIGAGALAIPLIVPIVGVLKETNRLKQKQAIADLLGRLDAELSKQRISREALNAYLLQARQFIELTISRGGSVSQRAAALRDILQGIIKAAEPRQTSQSNLPDVTDRRTYARNLVEVFKRQGGRTCSVTSTVSKNEPGWPKGVLGGVYGRASDPSALVFAQGELLTWQPWGRTAVTEYGHGTSNTGTSVVMGISPEHDTKSATNHGEVTCKFPDGTVIKVEASSNANF